MENEPPRLAVWRTPVSDQALLLIRHQTQWSTTMSTHALLMQRLRLRENHIFFALTIVIGVSLD